MRAIVGVLLCAAACGGANGADLCGDGTVWDGAHCVAAPDGGPDAAPDEPTACVGAKRPGACEERWSHAPKAKPDGLVEHTYDGRGRLVTSTSQALDDHGNWYVTLVESRTYDAADHLTRLEQRKDGELTYYEQYTYAKGQLTRQDTGQLGGAGNSTGFSVGATVYTYDGAGRLDHDDTDQDDDGIHRRRSYVYDAADHLVERDWDTQRDGVIDAKDFLAYDAAGLLATEDSDSDVDGTIDARTTYAHDRRGNLVREELDWGKVAEGQIGPDGVIDSRLSYVYDAACNLTHSESDSSGTGADGVPDVLTDYDFGCW